MTPTTEAISLPELAAELALNFAYGWDLENANNVFDKNQKHPLHGRANT